MGKVYICAGAKCREGKGVESLCLTVGKQIILKTEKFRDGNRSMLFRDMELNIKKIH